MESLRRMMLRERWMRLIEYEKSEIGLLASLQDDFLKIGMHTIVTILRDMETMKKKELSEKIKMLTDITRMIK